MKINTFRTLPKTINIAFSGGVDSVVMLHRAMQTCDNVQCLFFDHDDLFATVEREFVQRYTEKLGVSLIISDPCPKVQYGASMEEWWSNHRNDWFHSFEDPVATGHHLDDALEWYVMTCARGEGHWMSYSNQNVIRPLLTNPKSELYEYAEFHGLEYITDPNNFNAEWSLRTAVRNKLVPKIIETFGKGYYTMVKKKLIEKNS